MNFFITKNLGQNEITDNSFNLRSRSSQQYDHLLSLYTSRQTKAIKIDKDNPRPWFETTTTKSIVINDSKMDLYSTDILFHDDEEMKRNQVNAKIANITVVDPIGPEKTGSSTLQMGLNHYLRPTPGYETG